MVIRDRREDDEGVFINSPPIAIQEVCDTNELVPRTRRGIAIAVVTVALVVLGAFLYAIYVR